MTANRMFRAAAFATAAGILIGCASVIELAPPVSDAMVQTGADREILKRGRAL